MFDGGAKTFGGALWVVIVWPLVVNEDKEEVTPPPKSISQGRIGYSLWLAEDPPPAEPPVEGKVGSANGSPQGEPTVSLPKSFVRFKLSAPKASNSEPKEAPSDGNVGSV